MAPLKNENNNYFCPSCKKQSQYPPTPWSSIRIGDAINCDACKIDLEVKNIQPLKLDIITKPQVFTMREKTWNNK